MLIGRKCANMRDYSYVMLWRCLRAPPHCNEAEFLAFADRGTNGQCYLFRAHAFSAGAGTASDLSHRLGFSYRFLDLRGVLGTAAAHPLIGLSGCILTPVQVHMKETRTRRDFFQWTRGLLAAGGLASQAQPLRSAPTPTDPAEDGPDYYDKLGVAKIINAAGTYTILTASTMPPSVQAAVARAAETPGSPD